MSWLDIPLAVRSKFTIFGFTYDTAVGVNAQLDVVRGWIADIWTTPAGQNLLQANSNPVSIIGESNQSSLEGFRTLPDGVHIKMGSAATQGETGFLTKDGYYVQFTPQRLLYHEFVHAILGSPEGVWDASTPAVWDNIPADLQGPTVPLENAFAGEFETAVNGHSLDRPSYLSAGTKINLFNGGGSWTQKFDGSVDTVDQVIVDNANWNSRIDFSGFLGYKQLLVGAGGSDKLVGGQGSDFLYGDFKDKSYQFGPDASGDDFLFGGGWSGSATADGGEVSAGYGGSVADGQKWIDGASDYMEGGAGNDTYFTGGLKAGGGAFQTQFGATGRADLSYSINQAVYDQIDIISDSDGQGTIWVYSEQDGVAYVNGPPDLNAYRFATPTKITPTTYKQVSAGYWIAEGGVGGGLVYDQDTGLYLYTSNIDYINHDFGFLAYFAIKDFKWGTLGFNQGATPPPPPPNTPPPPPPSSGPVTIQGGGTRDVIVGTSGGDFIDASGGNDTINAGGGDDVIIGGGGKDLIDGGGGNDAASYTDSAISVDIDLQLYANQRGGTADGDVLFSIESIVGTGFDDSIRGSSNNNYLVGGAGSDVLEGRAGSDIIDGGLGTDRADFSGALSAYSLSNIAGYLTVTSALEGTDKLINIENLKFTDITLSTATTVTSPGSSFGVNENTSGVIYTATAASILSNPTFSYSLAGADASLFSINAATGALSFMSPPNFEAPVHAGPYAVSIIASDGLTSSAPVPLIITVTDVNEAPTITSSATASISENTTVVATIAATDPDAGTTLTYSISGGVDAAKFAVNSLTGALSFVSPPNFEAPTDVGANNVYDVIVQASDGLLTTTQAVAVTVTNVNEMPTITSSTTASIPENTTTVTTITATDPDAGTTLAYSISGGLDAAKFSINATTGALSFVSAPNFEAPTDFGANNVYDVVVQASDGSLNTTQAVAVTVTDVGVEGLSGITLSSSTVNENAANNTVVGLLTASGAPGGATLTYTLLNNASGRFSITGGNQLVVNNGVLLDFEQANSHSATVQVSDGLGGTFTQAFAISVANVDPENIAGTSVADVIYGGVLNDTIDGMTGDDQIFGGGGNDLITGGVGNDILDGGAGIDTLSYANATSAVTVELSQTGPRNTNGAGIDTYSNFENVIGSLFSGDYLVGTVGDNTIDGGGGVDSISYANATSGVTVSLAISGPQNTVGAGVDTLLGSFGTIYGTSYVDTLTGNALDNLIFGSGGADTLKGGQGNDTYFITDGSVIIVENAGEGIDVAAIQSSGILTYTLAANTENANIYGFASTQHVTVIGNGLDNTFNGSNWDDTIDGGIGADTMYGNGGSDTFYVDNVGDVVGGESTANIDNDAVYSSISYTLSQGIETLILTGSAAISGTGNDSDNVITGNLGNNTIAGGIGNDTIDGGAGNDILNGGAGTDTVSYATAASGVTVSLAVTTAQATGGSGSDTLAGFEALVGSAFNDALTGGTGNDVINGGAGSDTLNGGAGIDTVSYATATAAVTVSLAVTTAQATGGSGSDTLSNFEAIIGSAFNDSLTGSAGSDTLDGGVGIDTLAGGFGDDTYIVDVAGDVIVEAASAGTDTIKTALQTYSIASLANIENLTGTSTVGPQNLTGNAGNNVITGGFGNDNLYGGAGADSLIGGSGADIYFVDNVGDVIVEAFTGVAFEFDRVLTSVSFTLATGQDIENLETDNSTLTTAINLTGNEIRNYLIGNAGANILDGGAGNDSLTGGAGNDTYIVDNAGDTITETLGGGTADRVQTSSSYALAAAADIELLETTLASGTTTINLTGNALSNTITGNAGANTIEGGAAADNLFGGLGIDTASYALSTSGVAVSLSLSTAQVSGGDASGDILSGFENLTGSAFADTLTGAAGINVLTGGAGNDIYVIQDAGDVVTEIVGGGTDRVQTSVTYALATGTNIEFLETTLAAGTTAINLTGNEIANTMIGNAGVNTLNGGAGADTMTGGAGIDAFIFNTALGTTGIDVITDFTHLSDKIHLENGIMTAIGVTTGVLTTTQFWSSTTGLAHDADDHIIYNSTTGALNYDSNGNVAGGITQIAILGTTTHPAIITNTDFLVI
jgi:Ca2+-binding RTX toxin-like protein